MFEALFTLQLQLRRETLLDDVNLEVEARIPTYSSNGLSCIGVKPEVDCSDALAPISFPCLSASSLGTWELSWNAKSVLLRVSFRCPANASQETFLKNSFATIENASRTANAQKKSLSDSEATSLRGKVSQFLVHLLWGRPILPRRDN